jgi:hypothetical protein
MPKPDPASVLSSQNELFARVDEVLDGPSPDFGDQIPGLARVYLRDWAIGPLLSLARQMVRPPGPDDATGERWQRLAGLMLRRAHEAVGAEGGLDDPDDAPPEPFATAVSGLEREVLAPHGLSPGDREKLKAAIREVAGPLLPRAHEELFAWVVDRTPPAPPRAPGRAARAESGKGKNINAQMLDMLSKDMRHYDWSAGQWAGYLQCSKASVIETKAWAQIISFRAHVAAERTAKTGAFDGGRRKKRGG